MRGAILVLLAACAGDGPVLVSVSPTAGTAGDPVVITGERLCQEACPPAGYVSFGIDPQIDGAVTAWSDTQVDAIVPTQVSPGDVLIVVTVDGRSSNGVSFTVQ